MHTSNYTKWSNGKSCEKFHNSLFIYPWTSIHNTISDESGNTTYFMEVPMCTFSINTTFINCIVTKYSSHLEKISIFWEKELLFQFNLCTEWKEQIKTGAFSWLSLCKWKSVLYLLSIWCLQSNYSMHKSRFLKK